MTSPFDLGGRVVVVTGGNDGIGAAIAVGLAAAGARVAVLGRRREANEQVCGRITSGGGSAEPFTCDVNELASVERAFAEVLHRFGQLDVCFANAGVSGPTGAFLDLADDAFDDVYGVNVRGVFWTFRAAARHFVDRRGGGVLVATASAAAVIGEPRRAPYAATKGAVVALVKSLAVELAPHGVRVHALAPGLVRTAMTAEALDAPGFQRAALPRIPARRFGEPEDLVAAAVFLASDGAAWSTGQCLVVDGGRTIS